MKKFRGLLWGLVLIALGVIIGGKVLGFIEQDLFFDGWWTLFIIVPSFIGLFDRGSKTGNFIGLGIGAILLLACQDIIDFSEVWKLIIPFIFIIVGLSIILKTFFGGKIGKKINELNKKKKGDGSYYHQYAATFSGLDLNFDNEVVTGMELDAVFGGIDVDLSNAIINDDVVIKASAIFGGIDIKVPANVNVEVKSTSIIGGVSCDKPHLNDIGTKTIYINGSGIFGGVSIE